MKKLREMKKANVNALNMDELSVHLGEFSFDGISVYDFDGNIDKLIGCLKDD